MFVLVGTERGVPVLSISRKTKPSNSGLGFIDLLAITLVVVILQTTAIIDLGETLDPPQPTAYSVSVYQPPESSGSVADHLGFVMIGGHLLLWTRPEDPNFGIRALQRDFPLAGTAGSWEVREHWGHSGPNPSVHYQSDNPAAVEDFAATVAKNLNVEFDIVIAIGRPPRIKLFFTEDSTPFLMEVGYHKCHQGNVDANRYLGKLHPIIVKWSVLGDEVREGDSIRELSMHNADKWAESGKFSYSPVTDVKEALRSLSPRVGGGRSCGAKTAKECAENSPRQDWSYGSIEVEFDGSGLKVTDGHGAIFNAR